MKAATIAAALVGFHLGAAFAFGLSALRNRPETITRHDDYYDVELGPIGRIR